VDPITIAACFKAATTAIDLAKRGIAFYKEVKSTAGEVGDVLKDLKEQYHKITSPSPEQTRQYNEEVKRVQKVANSHPNDALNDVWDHLAVFVGEYEATVREMMVYNTPPELGDVWTRFERMWQQIVQEQNQALAEEMRKTQIILWRRRRAINQIKALTTWIGAVLFVVAWMWGVLILIRTSQTYRGLS